MHTSNIGTLLVETKMIVNKLRVYDLNEANIWYINTKRAEMDCDQYNQG